MKTATLKNGAIMYIRRAEKSDAAEILSYLKKIGSETDYLSFGFEGVGIDVVREEETITRINAAPTSVMILGIVDGKIVTIESLSATTKSRFSHNAEIGAGVLKEYWGLGIGTIMIKELIEFAKATNHLEVLHLTVMSENDRAISLYKKLGFEEVGRHQKFSKVGNKYFDAIEMDLLI